MIRQISHGLKLASLVVAVTASSVTLDAQAVQTAAAKKRHDGVKVLDRTRLGSYIEETAVVPHGRFGADLAMATGYEVYGVTFRGHGHSNERVKKLFDIRELGIEVAPKGMTYVESQDVFLFMEASVPTQFLVTDGKGRPRPTRQITYLPGTPLDYFPHPEGLAYLPPSSPFFPDHIVMILNLFPPDPPYYESRLEVLSLDGRVVHEIVLPPELRENYLTGITPTASGELLIGLNDQIWTIDVAGNILSAPVTTELFVEGLEQLSDGRIVVSEAAELHFFDQDLNRLQGDDLDAGLGLGLVGLWGVAWNPDDREHLLATNFEPTGITFEPQIIATLSPSLRSVGQLFELPEEDRFRILAMDYMPDEQRVAVLRWSYYGFRTPEIVLYTLSGQEVEVIDVSAVGDPFRFNYIPETGQFGITVWRQDYGGVDNKLKIVSRNGALVRELDFSNQGFTRVGSFTYFNPDHPSGGQFLILGDTASDLTHAWVTDFDGHVMSEFSYLEELGLLNLTDAVAITTGKYAGSFSALDNEGYEIVIFKLNDSR